MEGNGQKEGRRGENFKGLKSCEEMSCAIISDGVANMGSVLRTRSMNRSQTVSQSERTLPRWFGHCSTAQAQGSEENQ